MNSDKPVMPRPASFNIPSVPKSDHQREWEREQWENRPLWYDPRYKNPDAEE